MLSIFTYLSNDSTVDLKESIEHWEKYPLVGPLMMNMLGLQWLYSPSWSAPSLSEQRGYILFSIVVMTMIMYFNRVRLVIKHVDIITPMSFKVHIFF